ncbi:MAG: hypothetical protein KBT35_05805 [Firmicutes bacterium]|nr:hypothetical protein [Candidatus Colivicinus equi]
MIKKKDAGVESYWQFNLTTIDGETVPREFADLEKVDAYVEKLINDGTYRKTDIMVVQVSDFTVDTSLFKSSTTSDSEPTNPDLEPAEPEPTNPTESEDSEETP